MSTDSRFVSSLGYVRTADFFGGGAANGFRLDLYGQYVSAGGIGGYAAVPINYVSTDNDSDSAIGSLELGGLYLPKTSLPIVLRGGLVLGNAGYSDFATNMIAGYSRFTDFSTAMPDTTTLRASASVMQWQGTAFFRADLGLDLPISEPDEFDVNTIARLNLGAGVLAGQIAVMGELITVVNLEGDDGEERFIHFAAATARFMGTPMHPSISVSMPIDEDVRDTIDFIVIAGIEYQIPTH